MAGKLYLYPLWVRLWHGINAILIILLIVTGVSMQYSDMQNPFIRFDLAVSIHNICGIMLTVAHLWFVVGAFKTPNGSHYRVNYKGLVGRLKKQFNYYSFGIFKNERPPFPITTKLKFNPLQQFSYVITMFILVPIVIVSGWAFLYPEVILTRIMGGSGLMVNAFIHVIIGYFVSFFMFIHIYFCTIGASFTSNFMSMITGYHESK